MSNQSDILNKIKKRLEALKNEEKLAEVRFKKLDKLEYLKGLIESRIEKLEETVSDYDAQTQTKIPMLEDLAKVEKLILWSEENSVFLTTADMKEMNIIYKKYHGK